MILSKEEYRKQIDQDATAFWRNVTLYVTIEPCVMCASALRQLGKEEGLFSIHLLSSR